MNPAELQGQTILALEAKTLVNGKKNVSRFTNEEFILGSIIFERYDGVFFENISFENSEWRPFFRFETNQIELSNMTKKNACPITISQYEPK
jgi:hypothetical protein